MTKKLPGTLDDILALENPFLDDDAEFGGTCRGPRHTEEELLVDMTAHTGVRGRALRVELRRCHDPAVGSASPTERIAESSRLVGLISPEGTPREGEVFELNYHSYNGKADYGSVQSASPARNVFYKENFIFFDTEEGEWRLEILDAGN